MPARLNLGRQTAALPPQQPASLPPPVQPRASVYSGRTSQHVLRTRRSSPALMQQTGSSSTHSLLRLRQDVGNDHRLSSSNVHHTSSSSSSSSARSLSRPSRSLLTRSHSDVSTRDRLMSASAHGGLTVDNRRLSLDTHQLPQQPQLHHQQQQQQHYNAAHLFADGPTESLTGPPLYPATTTTVLPPTHPTYFPLPPNQPLTTADLARYLAAPAPVSNPYLVRASPASSWPMQTGIGVVPAAMLAADVLPEYYYALNHHDGLAAYPPSFHHASHPHHHHQQQQHRHPCPTSSSSLRQHQPRPPTDNVSYSDRRQHVNVDNASSFYMTQLPHGMTHLPRDMTQIPAAGPLLYPGDQHASTSAGSRQYFDELDAYTRRPADTRDWSTLTRSSEHAQPLFVHHFLSMLESTLGVVAVDESTHHLPPYAASHFRNYEALLGLARQLSESKPKGLCKADIDRLASFQFTAASTNHITDSGAVKQSSDGGVGAVTQTSCVVCMSEFVNRQRIRELPCQHIFHLKCIDKWLKTNRTCPLCRADVLDLLNSDTKPFIR